MAKRIRIATTLGIILSVSWILVETAGSAPKKRIITTLKLLPDAPQVKLFEGIENQELKVKVLPVSAYNSSVLITNQTKKPLTVEIPKAVSSVHILAQAVQNNGLLQGILDTPQTQTGDSQSVGGNLAPVGNNNNLNFFKQALFTIPAEKTVRLRLRSVCLEHGKPTPTSRKTYELRPIESQVQNKALVLLLKKFDPKYDDLKMMQAIAWHLGSHMNWSELAAKREHEIVAGGVPLFSPAQIQAAKKIVEAAQIHVAKEQSSKSQQIFSKSKTNSASTVKSVRQIRR